jgi:hypothetical protein
MRDEHIEQRVRGRRAADDMHAQRRTHDARGEQRPLHAEAAARKAESERTHTLAHSAEGRRNASSLTPNAHARACSQ